MIDDKDFIGNSWEQNCGDSLKVLEKTKIKKNNHFLYRCLFTKYPYEILASKERILSKKVLNPYIEEEKFINKIWPRIKNKISRNN